MRRFLASSALLLLCCAHEPEVADWSEDPGRASIATDAAYEGIVALLPASRLAWSTGDSRAVDRISVAMEDLLLVFDDQNSESSMQRLVALAYFYLGEHNGETYSCLIARKGPSIVPIIEQQLRSGADPCATEFGPGSPNCTSSFSTGSVEESLHGLASLAAAREPCEIER